MKPTCPRCHEVTTVDESNAFRPFCSERCRMLDLGAWLDGRYAIPGEPVGEAPLAGEDDESPTTRH